MLNFIAVPQKVNDLSHVQAFVTLLSDPKGTCHMSSALDPVWASGCRQTARDGRQVNPAEKKPPGDLDTHTVVLTLLLF